jgi:SHS2 domain-containing protein
MMADRGFGFSEIEHTADWALRVWAPDLPLLFSLAAQGMYSLMETTLQPHPREQRQITLEGEDDESLLVLFLAELLYLGESEGLGFDQFDIHIEEKHLTAQVQGAPVAQQRKEIKAVTYHNLAIRREGEALVVIIVFDV